MQRSRTNVNPPTGGASRLPHLSPFAPAAAAILLGLTGVAELSAQAPQTVPPAQSVAPAAGTIAVVEARPYGAPSEVTPGPTVLGLYLEHSGASGRAPALRLEGGAPGAPAVILFAAERSETTLPFGGQLLVGVPVAQATGSFDAAGVFRELLDPALFAARGGVLFAQGLQLATPAAAFGATGTELSQGLRLAPAAPPEVPARIEPPLPEPILVEELATLLRGRNLEAALDLGLNSDKDALALELGGNLEVPVWPGVTAGGKAQFKAALERGADDLGAVVYDLKIGADVAASVGVGVGIAGAGANVGAGGELIWRLQSTHEAARALRAMAVLQAIGPRLELCALALEAKMAELDHAIAAARRVVDRVRDLLRAHLPWSDTALARAVQQRLDHLREQRRQVGDRARRALAQIVGWVATERTFLNAHAHGFEVRGTSAIELSLGTSWGDSKQGGSLTLANLGAGVSAGVERQVSVRTERITGSSARRVEVKVTFTKQLAAAAGFGVGAAAQGKRVLELSHVRRTDEPRVPFAEAATVRLTLDGRLLGALGAVVTAQFGVGGEVTLQATLRDLLQHGDAAVAALLGDDVQRAVEVLRALPFEISLRSRYEAGMAFGLGLDVDGVFKGGIAASATMRDCGPAAVWRGGAAGAASAAGERLIEMLGAGPLRGGDAEVIARFEDVRREMLRVTQR